MRFQYMIQMASKKLKPVWLDVGKNLDVPCPHVKGKIIIKALRLPAGVAPQYKATLNTASKQANQAPTSDRD